MCVALSLSDVRNSASGLVKWVRMVVAIGLVRERVEGGRGRCEVRRGTQEGWRVVGGDACLGLRFVTGKRLWTVSVGSVRTAASRRIGIVREVLDPVSLVMDWQDLRMKEEGVARRRTCGHVVM